MSKGRKRPQKYPSPARIPDPDPTLEVVPPPQPVVKEQGWALHVAMAAIVLFLVIRTAVLYAPFTGMPWFNLSDENVLAGEVIRFSDGDYRQHFMDMPGTPLIGLWTLEWRLWFRLEGEPGQTINAFSFANIQQLFQMMRVTSLVFYCGSLLLVYALGLRVLNPIGAALACLLVAYEGALGNMATFVRVEPTTLFFILAAVLVLTSSRLRWQTALTAGALAGIAVGCRLHSVTLSVPLLCLLIWQRTWKQSAPYSRRMAGVYAALAVAGMVAGWIGYRHFSGSPNPPFPLAYRFLARACLGSAAGIAILVGLYFVPGVRRYVAKLVPPELLAAGTGMAAGALPTLLVVLGAWTYFLKSLEFYSGTGYIDPVASKLPFIPKLTSLFSFYLQQIAQGRFELVLLVAGTAVILLHPVWRQRLWPYPVVAFGFFFARPLSLLRATHHIALWIPFFAIVSAAAPAVLIDELERKLSNRRWAIQAAGCAFVLAACFICRDGALGGRYNMGLAFERLRNVEKAFNWIHTTVPVQTEVYTAFFCFGPDTFYGWMREMEVPVPPGLGTDRNYRTWWWDRAALRGHAGYACVTPGLDDHYIQEQNGQKKGVAISAPQDPGFHKLQAFGQGQNRMEIYQFDLRSK